MEYFKCDRDCAMFVAMDKLSEPEITKSSHARETVQPHPPQAQDGPLKLGDEVTFFDENDKPSNGVVRWIGMNKDILRDGSKIVGIETVSCMYCNIDKNKICTYLKLALCIMLIREFNLRTG